MNISTLNTFHIDESRVKKDGYLEIWWSKPQEGAEGEYWRNSDFIVIFYDGKGYEKPIGLLLEADDISLLSQKDWEEIETLKELPLRFTFKNKSNLTLPDLVRELTK